jgi:YhcG PDDEXK nuclease domain
MTEYELERTLLDRLQRFMLDFSGEFCLRARQLCVAWNAEGAPLGLLFFHRNLRCLIAIDIKLGEFLPEHLRQLHIHLHHLAENTMYSDGNPPVGILLCAEQDAEVVRLVMPINDDAFASRCQLELPRASQLRQWLHDERGRITERARGAAVESKIALG